MVSSSLSPTSGYLGQPVAYGTFAPDQNDCGSPAPNGSARISHQWGSGRRRHGPSHPRHPAEHGPDSNDRRRRRSGTGRSGRICPDRRPWSGYACPLERSNQYRHRAERRRVHRRHGTQPDPLRRCGERPGRRQRRRSGGRGEASGRGCPGALVVRATPYYLRGRCTSPAVRE